MLASDWAFEPLPRMEPPSLCCSEHTGYGWWAGLANSQHYLCTCVPTATGKPLQSPGLWKAYSPGDSAQLTVLALWVRTHQPLAFQRHFYNCISGVFFLVILHANSFSQELFQRYIILSIFTELLAVILQQKHVYLRSSSAAGSLAHPFSKLCS